MGGHLYVLPVTVTLQEILTMLILTVTGGVRRLLVLMLGDVT